MAADSEKVSAERLEASIFSYSNLRVSYLVGFMGTKNRRVATYLPPELDEAFILYKIEQGLASKKNPNQNDSQALIHLLSERLGVGEKSAYSSHSEAIDRLNELEKELNSIKSKLSNEVFNLRFSIREIEEKIEFSSAKVRNPGQIDLPGISSNEVPQKEANIFFLSPEQIPQDLLEGLTGMALAKRLKSTSRSTLLRHRGRGESHFREWTQSKDPDEIPWIFKDGTYFPVTSDMVDQLGV